MDREQLRILKEQNPFAPLHDLISDLIMQDIISFRIAPGARLVENAIAERFGVSRSPVRAALDRLLELGYLYQTDRHYYVKEFSAKEYRDLSDLSRIIEPYAAGEAAKKLKEKELKDLYDMAYELRRLYRLATGETISDSFMPLMDLEYKFHTMLVDAAGNEVISRIYEDYKYRIFYYRSYILTDPPEYVFGVLADDHILICNTLKLRDPDMAIAAVRHHLSVSKLIIQRSSILKTDLNGSGSAETNDEEKEKPTLFF